MFDLDSIKPRTRIQLHVLKSHAASNLNRDDLGRPKEMTFGGVPRLRISSQSLKRAIRTGEVFENFRTYAAENFGSTAMIRTTQIKQLLTAELEKLGVPADKIQEGVQAVAATMGGKNAEEDSTKTPKKGKAAEAVKPKAEEDAEPKDKGDTQLLALSIQEVMVIAQHLASYQDKSAKDWAKKAVDQLKALRAARKSRFMRGDLSPEMQLFGRMVTSDLFANIDARVQVAHSFTVHEAHSERDYWTGVDDHRVATGQAGSGMIDVRQFGAGVFYQYACIDVDGLLENLRDSHTELPDAKARELARDTINAFVMAFIGQNPTGYQNSFASNAMPSVIVAEIGGTFSVSAAAAYEVPVSSFSGQEQIGYSKAAADRFSDWLDQRRQNFGEESLGDIVSVGLDGQSGNLPELIKKVAATVSASA